MSEAAATTKRKKRGTPASLHAPIYLGIRAVTSLPLVVGAPTALGAARSIGGAFARLPSNRKRLARAIENLEQAFPGWSAEHRQRVAVGAYQHLFELAVEVLYTPRLLSEDAWVRHARIDGVFGAIGDLISGRPTLLLCGHCGNWEALGYIMAILGFPMHAVYRPLDMKPLDDWVRSVRARRGLVLVDKFGAMDSLGSLVAGGAPVGFVADQNAGDRGIFVPFFGRLASTYKSIALLAMHTGASIVVGSCIRTSRDVPSTDWAGGDSALGAGLASEAGFSGPLHDRGKLGAEAWFSRDGLRYEVRISDVFGPDDWRDAPDPAYYITARYRRAIEQTVRWAPEQYLWMHRIWKSRPPHERNDKPFPESLRKKLRGLPWMAEADVQAVVDRSERDREMLRHMTVKRG